MPSLLDRYHDLVRSGDLAADAAQERGVMALQSLCEGIKEPKHQSPANNFLGIALTILNPLSVLTQGFFYPPQLSFSGVYLYGPVGRGKTRVMDLFFETLPPDIPKRRVHFHAFMIGVHDFMHQQRLQANHNGVDDVLPRYAINVAATTRVLCFDEFHVLDVADAMILSRLFTALWDAGIVTVLTSNWAPDDLYKNGLQRDLFLLFISLLKSRLQVVRVDGARDYRLERLNGRQVYFTPLGAAADDAVTALWGDLTDNMDPEPCLLNVKGRDLLIARAGRGVARLSFADLCEKPLGAEDYLAIAAAFHTVIIDHVPKLSYDRRNEAKRFVTLIDVLYERHRRVILSADAPPDHLYVAGDHAFEFGRTVSRLQEMQSAAYLQACLSGTPAAL